MADAVDTLGFGFSFADLYDRAALVRLDGLFLDKLASANAELHQHLLTARGNPDAVAAKDEGNLLIGGRLGGRHEGGRALMPARRETLAGSVKQWQAPPAEPLPPRSPYCSETDGAVVGTPVSISRSIPGSSCRATLNSRAASSLHPRAAAACPR